MDNLKTASDATIFLNSTLIIKIPKNKLEEIRISVLKNDRVDVRIHFYFPGDPEPKPTKKGIWLAFDQIKPILDAFEKYVANNEAEFNLQFEKSKKEKIRVYIGEFKGKKIVHIRFFYLKDEEFNPGKGVSFPIAIMPQMVEGFKKAQQFFETQAEG